MVSDPIADMLTRVRNALQARHPKVDVPASKLKAEIARILKEEGYIANFKVAEEGAKSVIKIYLKYTSEGQPVVQHLKRESRPQLFVALTATFFQQWTGINTVIFYGEQHDLWITI